MRSGWNRSYLAIVLLTFGALLLMAFISFHALSIQRIEESRRETVLARTRVESAALTFFEGLPRRLSELTSLRRQDEIAIPRLRVPVDLLSTEILARAAGSEERRVHFLEGFLNAPQSEKLFWALLLFRDTPDERSFARLRNLAGDARLPDGLSVKARCAIDLAGSLFQGGLTGKAAELLLLAGSLPPPDPLPADPAAVCRQLSIDGPGSDESGERRLCEIASLVHWAWKAAGNRTVPPGWHLHGGTRILSVENSEGFTFALGDNVFTEYLSVLKRAAGGGFDLKESDGDKAIAAGDDSVSFPLPYCSFSTCTLTPVVGAVALHLYGSVWFGAVVSVVLAGFSIMVLHGLRRNQEKLLASEREVFFRQAAHDLKTPLTTLRVLAETLAMKRVRSEERRDHYLASMIGEIDRAAELVDTMLMTARLESRAIQPRFEKFSPEEIISMLLRRFRPRLEGWKLEVDCPPSQHVLADPGMFERAVVNMIENALRHAGEGKELTLVARRRGDGVSRSGRNCGGLALTVCDRGPGTRGLPAGSGKGSFQATVPETQGAPETSGEPSTGDKVSGRRGFGLFLMEMILELHDGTITFCDREGSGLMVKTFWPDQEAT